MKEVRKEEVIKVLNEGAILYLKGSIRGEERFYRLTDNKVEYSDNSKDWTISNISIEEMETREWIVWER